MVKKALIIAAGCGSRLQQKGKSIPKPLRKVAGLPLLKRIILSAKRGGLSEFVIVVGYEKERLISALQKENLGVKLQFVTNPDWEKPNGLSVLAAKPYIRENFVLLMADHIFDPTTLDKLRRQPLDHCKTILAIDYNIDSIFDLDDATKVLEQNSQVQQIDKSLIHYNAIDTGMFLASPDLFEALEESKKDGKFSLSDGIRLLASKGQMRTFDIGHAFWHDIDTPESLKNAEKQLFNACRKQTDGFISRNFNRHISLFISRLLLKTNLSANHVTGLTTLVGILSGVFVAQGDYWNLVLGATLFKFASILDGCDGEISKLKLTNSRLGQWLDTLSDNLTYVLFIIGSIIGLANRDYLYIKLLGSLTILSLGMTLLVMFAYLLRHSNSGTLLTIQKDFQKASHQGLLKRFFNSISFMAKRDFFALLFLVLALLNRLDLIVWICFGGSTIIWTVLLSTKFGLFKTSPVVAKESPDPTSR